MFHQCIKSDHPSFAAASLIFNWNAIRSFLVTMRVKACGLHVRLISEPLCTEEFTQTRCVLTPVIAWLLRKVAIDLSQGAQPRWFQAVELP